MANIPLAKDLVQESVVDHKEAMLRKTPSFTIAQTPGERLRRHLPIK